MQVQDYHRMFNSGVFAASYLLGAYIVIVFLRNKKVGHRILLRWAAAYLMMRAVTLVCAAVAIYTQSFDIATWFSSSTAIVSCVLFTYLFSVRHDVEVTLEDSELRDRVRHDKISDTVMAARNVRIVSHAMTENLRTSLESRRRIGPTATAHYERKARG
jgi:hypothetical protein